MPAYLLEIGTEELPSSFVTDAQNSLSDGLAEALRSKNISFARVEGLSTPRRLTAIVHDIASVQDTTSKKIKGPPVATSFEADGKPKPAAQGFAAKHSLTVEQLERELHGGQLYLVANVVSHGKPVQDILQEIVPRLISQLSGERMMRWGSSEFKFSRPIRWVVSLLDEAVVPFAINNLAAGRLSYGHRILHPEPVSITSPESYVRDLLGASVQVDPLQRRQTIESEVMSLAARLGGRPRQLTGGLLDEVVNITEWPAAVAGDFAVEYLDLPDTLIETVMVHHQKYFPVEKLDAASGEARTSGQLLPHFITVANNDRKEAAGQIKQGNERVLKARLADGRFFYFDDQKTTLSDRRHIVAQLTFQEGLGSYGDKVARMSRVAEKMALAWDLTAQETVPLERTLELCKSDLVTNLVRELPELQGFVGAWYAESEGQPPEVVRALASHYAPRSADDSIPQDKVGQLASVIDKADNLVGLFSIGKKPTGSSDPFALRRYAQGLVDVLMDGLREVPLHITALLKELLSEFEPLIARQKRAIPGDKVLEDLSEFLALRIRTKLAANFSREIVEAALSASDELDYLPNIVARARAMQQLTMTAGGIDVIRAGVRIANILKAQQSISDVDVSVFSEEAERQLWTVYKNSAPERAAHSVAGVRKLVRMADCERAIACLEPLVAPINKFFEEVMVNDENLARRKNRHALLHALYLEYKLVGDFSKLQPLIN